MNHFDPFLAQEPIGFQRGELLPSTVDIYSVTVGIARPHQVTYCFGKGSVASLTYTKRLFNALAFGDVARDPLHSCRLAVPVNQPAANFERQRRAAPGGELDFISSKRFASELAVEHLPHHVNIVRLNLCSDGLVGKLLESIPGQAFARLVQ